MKLFCPKCFSTELIKQGFSPNGKQRYFCKKSGHQTVHPLQPNDVELACVNLKIAKTLTSEGKRKCCKCKEFKKHSFFHKDRTKKNGLSITCTDCHRFYMKEYRKRNRKRNMQGNTIKTKYCNKCNQTKGVENFTQDFSKKDGFRHSCKDCQKIRRDKWAAENPEWWEKQKEINRIKSKKWKENNREKHLGNNRKYRLNNRDKINKTAREYYRNNPERLMEYYRNNPEKLKKMKEWRKGYRLIYNQVNKDRIKAVRKQYVLKNKVKIREKARSYANDRYKDERELLSDWYVKHLLVSGTTLSGSDIPKELIDAKRQHLKLTITTKEI